MTILALTVPYSETGRHAHRQGPAQLGPPTDRTYKLTVMPHREMPFGAEHAIGSSPFAPGLGMAGNAQSAEDRVQAGLVANRAALGNTLAPLARIVGAQGTGNSAVSDLLESHVQLGDQAKILKFDDEFTAHGKDHGGSSFPASHFFTSTLKAEYAGYCEFITNKVRFEARLMGKTLKPADALTPAGFIPAFEYMPLLGIFEAIKHIVRREAQYFTPEDEDSQAYFKAVAWPKAMLAMQHAICFCMIYGIPAQLEVYHRLGRVGVINNVSMDVLKVVVKQLRQVSVLPAYCTARPGFSSGSKAFVNNYPGMAVRGKKQQPGKTRMQKGRGRGRSGQVRGGGYLAYDHANSRRGNRQPGMRGGFGFAGRGARGRGRGGARGRGRGQ